ncbi:uncharacterized protein DSM5745_09894 [Aspergillus mulundensis]|uniref:Uncharacterized protein n=1 Tax=Aspergillus mulundensis TaxID=1810919 RepID=A0A3D8QRN2_9EURO|nr:hypothetical protein DSM5745_09894 [Aspergillus mulundensis]RDW64483.1 hypothetical protein DSM5745_09894 [Aspergillus mulundensis]
MTDSDTVLPNTGSQAQTKHGGITKTVVTTTATEVQNPSMEETTGNVLDAGDAMYPDVEDNDEPAVYLYDPVTKEYTGKVVGEEVDTVARGLNEDVK